MVSRSVVNMGISLLFSPISTWPNTSPLSWSKHAITIRARCSPSREPRSAFPSTAIAQRRRLPDVPAALTRPDSQAPIAVSNASPVNAESARRTVDAFGAPIPIPRKVPSTASAAHSAIAANDRAPETTAHTDTNRIAENRCRTPRFLRGSGTDSNTSSNPARVSGVTSPSGVRWRDKAAIGDDDPAGTARAPKVTMA
jgi:hypothetical protein